MLGAPTACLHDPLLRRAQVLDHKGWGTDELIGRTLVDLEDRWFDPKWQAIGAESKCSDVGKVRWCTKV